jgi:hypothetical protein
LGGLVLEAVEGDESDGVLRTHKVDLSESSLKNREQLLLQILVVADSLFLLASGLLAFRLSSRPSLHLTAPHLRPAAAHCLHLPDEVVHVLQIVAEFDLDD